MKSLKDLFLSPATADAFPPERLARMEQTLVEDNKTDMPWYLRIIIGIGAWLSSLFFFVFAIIFIGFDHLQQSFVGVTGIILLVVAVIVGRQKYGIFIGQCVLAVSLAAEAMIYVGFVPDHGFFDFATAIAISLATVLYFVYPDFLSRLINCVVALQMFLFWIVTDEDSFPFTEIARARPETSASLILFWALQLAVLCGCFLPIRYSRLLAPLGYALIISLAAWQIENISGLFSHVFMIVAYTPVWVGWMLAMMRPISTAVTFLVVAIWAAGGVSILKTHAPVFLGLAMALAALIWLGAGGVILALLFLLLGFALQNSAIMGVAVILFAVFLTNYYYYLRFDLMAKAGVLVGSGLVLLVLRAGLKTWAATNLKETA